MYQEEPQEMEVGTLQHQQEVAAWDLPDLHLRTRMLLNQ